MEHLEESLWASWGTGRPVAAKEISVIVKETLLKIAF
jgi:hypothetical protein